MRHKSNKIQFNASEDSYIYIEMKEMTKGLIRHLSITERELNVPITNCRKSRASLGRPRTSQTHNCRSEEREA